MTTVERERPGRFVRAFSIPPSTPCYFAAPSPTGIQMLQITELTLRIAGRPLIEGANLTLPEGAKAGFVGRNGSGKTTLFRAIAGEISPDAGAMPRCCGTFPASSRPARGSLAAVPSVVIAGLDPAIHSIGNGMGARIKSGHDESVAVVHDSALRRGSRAKSCQRSCPLLARGWRAEKRKAFRCPCRSTAGASRRATCAAKRMLISQTSPAAGPALL